MRQNFGGGEHKGWWSYVENDVFRIGNSNSSKDKALYQGEYKGEETPYLLDLKADDPKQYYRIAKCFCNKSPASFPPEISSSEKIELKNRIVEILRAAVDDDYVRCIIANVSPETNRTFIDDVIETVLVSSNWEDEHFYCNMDIRYAIGQTIASRLNIQR